MRKRESVLKPGHAARDPTMAAGSMMRKPQRSNSGVEHVRRVKRGTLTPVTDSLEG